MTINDELRAMRERMETAIITTIEYDAPPALVHPCQRGHAWAWLNAGGQECYNCGMRR